MENRAPLKPLTRSQPDIKPLPSKSAPKPGPSLTFSDGLNFGCGFWVAGFLFAIFAVPLAAFILTLLGVLAGAGR